MIATDLATTIVADTKDAELELTVTLEDGTEHTGRPISVNSKGVNIEVDGKVRSFGLKRIASLTNGEEDEDAELSGDEIADLIDAGELEGDEDEAIDEEIYAELHDGMSTAELAAIFSEATDTDLTPKELRVHLRALGLGVGKGRKYSLSATEYRLVKGLIETPAN